MQTFLDIKFSDQSNARITAHQFFVDDGPATALGINAGSTYLTLILSDAQIDQLHEALSARRGEIARRNVQEAERTVTPEQKAKILASHLARSTQRVRP